MKIEVSNNVDVGATMVLVVLGVAVAGQWLIMDVLEPKFGLKDLLW